MVLEGRRAKVGGANDKACAVVATAVQLIVETRMHEALQCGYVLAISCFIFQPRHRVDRLVVISDPLLYRPRCFFEGPARSPLLSVVSEDALVDRATAGRFLPDIFSAHMQL